MLNQKLATMYLRLLMYQGAHCQLDAATAAIVSNANALLEVDDAQMPLRQLHLERGKYGLGLSVINMG
jgi:hypothetical protein